MDAHNKVFVLLGKKQLRRRIRKTNGCWNIIISQKNLCGSQWLLEWVIGNVFFVKSSLVGQGSSSCIAEMFFVLLSNESCADVSCYVLLRYKESQTQTTFWMLFLLKPFEGQVLSKVLQRPSFIYKICQKEALQGSGPFSLLWGTGHVARPTSVCMIQASGFLSSQCDVLL